MRPIKFELIYDNWLPTIVANLSEIANFEPWSAETLWAYKREFTWLLDKNGREIYFDDLVQAPSWNIFQVIWYEDEVRIALKYKDTIYNFNVPLYEVIWNIYDNPDLLSN